MHQKRKNKIAIFLLLYCFGCYSTEKKYVPARPYDVFTESEMFLGEEPQFESGEPYFLLDFLASWTLGILGKLVILDTNMSNHQINGETKKYLIEYMKFNNLKDVKVRFNQYAPISDFRRLNTSKRVHWWLRYTIGVLNCIFRMILPDRALSIIIGDHYDPATNTIYLYSNLPAVVLHEGGHAKDFAQRTYPTAYSMTGTFLSNLPVVGKVAGLIPSLYFESRASDDVIRYLRYKCEKARELQGYKQLYPAYSTYLFGPILGLPGAIPGHIWGGRKAKKELYSEEPVECTNLE
ncbi:MAG: hypothetical protein K8R21_06590 [Leptospira sp.]|nr:hypothetical protein [Leptospira sp.]